MKKLLILTILSMTTGFGCGGQTTSQESAKDLPDYLHACYTTRELISAQELLCPGYGDFDIMFMMAMPPWTTYDFDCTREQARSYAENFSYTAAKGDFSHIQEIEHISNSQTVVDQFALIPQMIAKAHQAGTPVLLCLGGQKEFIPFMEKPRMLHRLADYVVRMVELNDYDGVDLDWEIYFDKELHIMLSDDIRSRLDSLGALNGRRYYLTSALSIDHVYDQDLAGRLSTSHDWINVMSYDMGGGIWGDVPRHNTSLATLKAKLSNWKHFDRSKICLGLANYGFYYKGLKPEQKVTGSLKKWGRYITYKEFASWKDERGWTEWWDEEAQVPYYFSPDGNEFVTMEKAESILIKVEEIKKMGFRGVFWWEFHHDYRKPNDTATPGAHPLIDVVTKWMKDNE